MFALDRRRASFYIFLEALSKLFPGISAENALIMPFVIRVHQTLVNGRSKYTLDLAVGTSNQVAVEKKLQKSDVFMLTGLKLGIQKYDPANPDFNSPIFGYADPTFFTAAIAKQIEKIFQGNLSLKTGTQTRIDQLDNDLLKLVPNGNFAGTLAAPTDYPEHGGSLEGKGYFDLGSYPILLGENKNTIEIELASGDISGIADTGAGSNNLVLMALGWVYRGDVSPGGQCTSF